MTLPPVFTSACELADKLPAMIGDFLDLDWALGRRFREDSLTDIIIASFLKLASSEVAIQTPNEWKTGSDFDLLIADLDASTVIQYRIQAKRLYSHVSKWALGSYRELAHPKNSGKQAAKLVDPANLTGPIPTVPLYAFYNPSTVCSAAGNCFQGVALADGYEVSAIVQKIASGSPKPTTARRVSEMHHLFFPLANLLCPPPKAVAKLVASPDQSLRQVNEAIISRQTSQSPSRSLYEVGRQIPADVRQALESAGDQRITRVARPRPRIILGAGSPSSET